MESEIPWHDMNAHENVGFMDDKGKIQGHGHEVLVEESEMKALLVTHASLFHKHSITTESSPFYYRTSREKVQNFAHGL